MSAKEKPVTLKASKMTRHPVMGHVHFAMVELLALEGLGDLIGRAPQAAQLLVKLIRRMTPGSSGVIVVSRETMRELLGVSLPTVDRALKVLVNEGWLQRIRIGGAYALAINRQVAWIGARGDIQHAVFDATVIASRTEQDAIALNPPPLRTVPVLHPDEDLLPVESGMDLPSQPELDGIEPLAVVGDALKLHDEQEHV